MIEIELAVAVGKRVKLARTMRGLSQRELAQKVGITTQGLSQIETGRRLPSLMSISDIAEATEFEVFWFMWPYEEDPKTMESAGRLHRVLRLVRRAPDC